MCINDLFYYLSHKNHICNDVDTSVLSIINSLEKLTLSMSDVIKVEVSFIQRLKKIFCSLKAALLLAVRYNDDNLNLPGSIITNSTGGHIF